MMLNFCGDRNHIVELELCALDFRYRFSATGMLSLLASEIAASWYAGALANAAEAGNQIYQLSAVIDSDNTLWPLAQIVASPTDVITMASTNIPQHLATRPWPMWITERRTRVASISNSDKSGSLNQRSTVPIVGWLRKRGKLIASWLTEKASMRKMSAWSSRVNEPTR